MSIYSVITSQLAEHTSSQVVIFGLEREGLSTYRFLRQHLPHLPLLLCDDKPVTTVAAEFQDILKSDTAVRFVPSADLAQQLSSTQPCILYKSAGIPFTHAIIAELQTRFPTSHQKVTSNTELCFQLLHTLPTTERPITIGITGTKGKSTTSSLIAHVLKESGIYTELAGNIGRPALDVIAVVSQKNPSELPSAAIVFELSSHQLQRLELSPHIAVLQNITPEHLDYYATFEEYVAAKANLTTHQSENDYLLFNPTYEILGTLASQSKAQQLQFSLDAALPNLTAFLRDGGLYFKNELICMADILPLRGEHNILNTLPAIMIAKQLGVPNEKIVAALQSFQPLPHRLQFVANKNGVEYFNDSQGTTPEASIAAISSFPGKQIILIAGGSDKGVAFDELATAIHSAAVTTVLLFPPTGEKIAQAIREAAPATQNELAVTNELVVTEVASMAEAVAQAAAAAEPGSVVLLSPACASFGLFKNYQDRGNQFIAAVEQLPE